MKIALILPFILISNISFACKMEDNSLSKITKKDFSTVQEKKENFKNIVLNPIKNVYDELNCEHKKLQQLILSGNDDTSYYENLRKKYRAKDNNELLSKLKPHPISITLAQAALESSWATSRFSLEANNLFGVWSFDPNEPRIPANEKRGSKTIYLKKYSTIKESIYDYYLNLSKNTNYKDFVRFKNETIDPHIIVTGLDKYSEKGADYGKTLSSMIKFNKFDQYDKQ